jgi:hypothetical protein
MDEKDSRFWLPPADKLQTPLKAHVPRPVMDGLLKKVSLRNQDIRLSEQHFLMMTDIYKIRCVDDLFSPPPSLLFENVSHAPLGRMAMDRIEGNNAGFQIPQGHTGCGNSPLQKLPDQITKTLLDDSPCFFCGKGGDWSPSARAATPAKRLQFVQTDIMVTVTMGDENGVNILDPPPLQLDTDIGATVDQKVLSGPEKQSGPKPFFTQFHHILADATLTTMFW